MPNFDGRPTLNEKDPKAFSKFAKKLDTSLSGWEWDTDALHPRHVCFELAEEALARRLRRGSPPQGVRLSEADHRLLKLSPQQARRSLLQRYQRYAANRGR